MSEADRRRLITEWVGREILPHEPDLRAWLRHMANCEDIDDFIQEAYCRIAGLKAVDHIRNPRAYLFTTIKMLVIEHVRKSRVVNIKALNEFESLQQISDDPLPDRVVSARFELERTRAAIQALPERCRKIFEMRKFQGMSQKAIANALGTTEHVVENDLAKGLRLVLQSMAGDGQEEPRIHRRMRNHETARNG